MAKRPRQVPYRSYEDLRTIAADFLAAHHPVGSSRSPLKRSSSFNFVWTSSLLRECYREKTSMLLSLGI